MKLREAVLSQFEPDIASALIEFGKSLSTIDADILVFMARKSLRLYDVLLKIGIPPVERMLVSDRILDMLLDPIAGKKVALIDDTIILGTTLAKAKHYLEDNTGASVSIHTFCVDSKWWLKELITPDSIILKLDDRQVMSFCTAEVRAMSIVPTPYLVDFPFSLPIRIRLGDSQCFLSSVEWNSHRISTDIQERNNVTVLSFFPSEFALSETFLGLGKQFLNLLEIVKVRAFVRTHENVHWIQLVPIVTLKPLREVDLSDLLKTILDRISETSNTDLNRVLEFARTSRAQHRLVQFILSVALGSNFMNTIDKSIGSSIEKGYELTESERHFGPWLSNELYHILLHSHIALSKNHSRKINSINSPILHSDSTEAKNNSVPTRNHHGMKINDSTNYANLISDFAEIFLDLYDDYEIPARQEAHAMGDRVLSAAPKQAPYRDRLEHGMTWSSIVKHITSKHGIKQNEKIENILSLVLDICNDVGITVPVTCVKDGIVFRGYRHGEDVRFSDAELALAYECVNGLLKTTHRDSVPHLVLEKLLVLLIKVGAAKRFLEPFWGPSGTEGTVRIGFYLKGAVPILARGSKYRPDRDIWLSRYLIKRGVLNIDESNHLYRLGNNVEGNFLLPSAPDDSFELGYVLGMLIRSSEDPERKEAPLETQDLIILSTCWNPRHTAAALEVELDIFKDWFETEGARKLTLTNWKNPDSILSAIDTLVQSKGHEAVHSAKMKYVGYTSGRNEAKVQECEDYLRIVKANENLARKWKSYWNAVTASRNIGEKERFDPLINKSILLSWEIASCLSAIEISLSTSLADYRFDPLYNPKKAFAKLFTYSDDLTKLGLAQPNLVSKIVKRFKEIESLSLTNLDKESVVKYCLNYLSKLLPTIAGLIETMGPIIEEFGRIYGRHDYKYVLWYDIKDSSGNQSGLAGKDLENYRKDVKAYKSWVNEQFHRLSLLARKDNGEIYCFNGNASSTNDEKHVFLGGKFARRYLIDVLLMLLQGTLSFPVIRLRIYLVPCNFAGTSAFRRESEPEVQGDRFWEHFSRLKRNSSAFELQCQNDKSFMLIATHELSNILKLPLELIWSNTKENIVASEIELLSRNTVVKYGELNIILK